MPKNAMCEYKNVCHVRFYQQLNHLDKYIVSTTPNVLECRQYLQQVHKYLQHGDKSNNRNNASDQFVLKSTYH